MAFKKLPRSGGQPTVVMTGQLWDRLCDMVEQGLNISVAHPLSVAKHDGGTVISIDNSIIAIAKTRATQSGKSGRYDARSVYLSPSAASASGNIAATDIGTESATDNITVWELGAVQCYRAGIMIGADSGGKPVMLAFDRGFFPVKVTQNGGSDGNKTTAASWTYDVSDLADNKLTGDTPIGQEKPRPFGTVTAGSSYGVAFYDGSTLKLWDAGETPGTGGCS
jgi:hypothetical protein